LTTCSNGDIRIAVTAEAYEALGATLPLGSVDYEAKRSADGQIFTSLERPRPRPPRRDAPARRGGYSEVIPRMAKIEASAPRRAAMIRTLSKVILRRVALDGRVQR
jgi:hypothetical protein